MTRCFGTGVTHLAALVLVLSLPGSSGGEGRTEQVLKKMKAAPTEITFEGQAPGLRGDFWIDAGPGIDPTTGRVDSSPGPLSGVVQLVSRDTKKPVPAGFKASSLWLAKGQDVWRYPKLEMDTTPPSAGEVRWKLPLIGPNWSVNSGLFAVIRLEAPDGRAHLLRSPETTIEEVQ